MAQLVVKGKNVDVSEPLHTYVEKKIGKLDHHLDKITAVTVELSKESHKASNDRQVVQVTMQLNGQTLRAEESSADMYAAIDVVVDKLERSLERYKSKFYRKDTIRKTRREEARMASQQEAVAAAVQEAVAAGETGDSGITHTKRFQIKPMSADEATDQMELLGHDFYLFLNEDTAGVCVVYKRKSGSYGLLIPESA
jgi:putative sigma-54 modulation protein